MRYAEKRFFSNPGTRFHTLYTPEVSPDGTVGLVKSGVEDTDEYIESFAASTDINVILTRVANGETQLLKSRPGSFGDFTKLPQTYAEALQLQIDSHNLFASLPMEVRAEFGDDPNRFFASSGTKEWYEKLDPVLPDEVKNVIFPKVDITPVEPVKGDEKE